MSPQQPHTYERVLCPECKRMISVSKERVMRPHRNASWSGQCAGAGRRYERSGLAG